MIERRERVREVRRLLREFPVVGILGARQTGKTTLAKQVAEAAKGRIHRFDLEDPDDRNLLAEPMLALRKLRGLIVLDEIQRVPGLFEVLRVLADRRPRPARFLVLGSASPDLLRQSSESLAGRIAYIELDGFSLAEVETASLDRLWLRGGLPRSFLARTLAESRRWRSAYVRTFLERDLPQLGFRVSSTTLDRFWSMLAHVHGQTWNASAFARSFGVSDHAIRNYLDVLTSSLVVRQLRPWVENLKKRQVKSPKILLSDSGILHQLLGIEDMHQLERHPKVGASWEGFALATVVDRLKADWRECYFWATHAGAELDLLIVRGHRRLGFEFKRSTAPKMTKSMRAAMESLRLKQLTVVHAGEAEYALAENIRAVPLDRVPSELRPLR